ncbi:MAG: hypothetical protein LC105_05380 [Chitinophagales bacterium]|nr:hypothetical protein [Chitinophagales bacterium]
MPARIPGAVNPSIISDFDSNAEKSRYNSTTDDLLDRIRTGVENIAVGDITNNISVADQSFFLLDRWVYFDVGENDVRAERIIVIYDKNYNIVGVNHQNGAFFPLNDLPTIFAVNEKPYLLTFICRLDGSEAITLNWDNQAGFSTNIFQKITISDIEQRNLFSLELVVLPDSIINDDDSENYYEVKINSVAFRYSLSGYGIPIINHYHLDISESMNDIEITCGVGIKLELRINFTTPKLDE